MLGGGSFLRVLKSGILGSRCEASCETQRMVFGIMFSYPIGLLEKNINKLLVICWGYVLKTKVSLIVIMKTRSRDVV